MSAAGRGAVRVEHDFYATPAWCVELISGHINWDLVFSACEPCVGDGAIIKACPPGVKWETFEIREGRDYLTQRIYPLVTLVLTNPPFNIATDFAKRSLSHSLCIVYLLRINYLESEDRFEFLTENTPSHIYVLSKRPSFVDVCTGFAKGTIKDGVVLKEKIKGCGWAFHKEAKIKICPNCGGKVKAGTDATGYAWICWDKSGVMRDKPGIHFLRPKFVAAGEAQA